MSQKTKTTEYTTGNIIQFKGNRYAPDMKDASSESFSIDSEKGVKGPMVDGLFAITFRNPSGSHSASLALWLDEVKELHSLLSSFLETTPK